MPDGHFGPLPETKSSGSELVRSGRFIDIEILGGVSVTGTISGGTFTDGTIDGATITGAVTGIWYNSSVTTTVTLTASAGTYQDVASVVLGPAGTYLCFTNGSIEASIAADVAWTGALAAPTTNVTWTKFTGRGASHSGDHRGQLSPTGTVVTASAGETLNYRVARDVTSGTQLVKYVSVHAIRIA